MDVLSLLRLVVRRWRVTAPAAVLTLVALVAATRLSSPTYEATGSVVLLSPPDAPGVDAAPGAAPPLDVGQNPFTRYDDLSVVADIVARVMDSDSRREAFVPQGVTDYEVVVNQFQRGPVVDVTASGSSPEEAIHSTETVLTELDTVLAELQLAEGADPEYFITSAPLDPPSSATAVYGSTVRVAIGTLAVGALGTLGLAVLSEALARRRAVVRGGPDRAASEAASPSTGPGDPNGSAAAAPGASHGPAQPDVKAAERQPAQLTSAPHEPPSGSPGDNGRTPPAANGSS
jgi:hypothetical protein